MFDIYTLILIFFLLSTCMILWVAYSMKNFNYDSIEVLNQINIKQGIVLLLEYNTMNHELSCLDGAQIHVSLYYHFNLCAVLNNK